MPVLMPCRMAGCPELVERAGFCPQHRRAVERARKKTFNYSSTAWRRARRRFLRANPLCLHCAEDGRVVTATVVDHIVPHKGDMGLVWDTENWQALCRSCHSVKTVKYDGGFGRPVRLAPGVDRPTYG